MKNQIRQLALCVAACAIAGTALAQTPPPAAPAPAPGSALDLVLQGRKLETAGKLDEALAAYRKAEQKDPALFDAHIALGRALDVKGSYAEARKHLERAIELAPADAQNQALAAMAVSYAFEQKGTEAAKYYQKVFDKQMQAGAFDGAAGTANALGRVYLETGDVANAEKWYRTGNETSKKLEKLPADQLDLWEMRWHHAQGRIAARRGQFDAARKHAADVKSVIDRGRLDEAQRANYPYLAGYIAFYQGDYDAAIAELSKGSQDDAFVLGLIAQSYDKKRDHAKAKEYYAKALAIPGHSLQVAFTRPMAQKHVTH